MKVAYILNSPRAASYKVQQMILPHLVHGVSFFSGAVTGADPCVNFRQADSL